MLSFPAPDFILNRLTRNDLTTLSRHKILASHQTFTAPLINMRTGRYVTDLTAIADLIEADPVGNITIVVTASFDEELKVICLKMLALSYLVRSCWDLGAGPIKLRCDKLHYHLEVLVSLEDEHKFTLLVEQILNSRSI